tara:strand:+ start:1510 stop:2949 length:1440 start_codon:yes stop_codon:yes gene_type:complete
MYNYLFGGITSFITSTIIYKMCIKQGKPTEKTNYILRKSEDLRTQLDKEDLSMLEEYVDKKWNKEYKYSNVFYSSDIFYEMISEYIYLEYPEQISKIKYSENINMKEYRYKGLMKILKDNAHKKIIPDECDFVINYQNQAIKIEIMNLYDKYVRDKILTSNNCGGMYEELLKKIEIKSDSKEILINFIESARNKMMNIYQKNMENSEDTISIWLYKKDWWSLLSHTPKRSIESVYLKKGQKETIYDSISKFYDEYTRIEYLKYGVPYKFVVLLWGIPGSGKTTVIKSVASELNCNIYVLPISKNMNDYDFIEAFSGINDDNNDHNNKNKIIVIEDIDTIFTERKSGDDIINIGLQSILNCIDGLSFSEGTVLFLTANQPQKIDYALLRSGRINLKVELGYADEYQTKQMYSTYFEKDCDLFYSKIQHLEYTTADLQELFFKNKDQDSCIDKIDDLQEIIKLNKPEKYLEKESTDGYLYN